MNSTEHCLKRKMKKVIELMKDELRGKLMEEFSVLRPNTHSYLTDGNKKAQKNKKPKKVPETLYLKIINVV